MILLSKKRSPLYRKIFGYVDVSFDDEFVKFESQKETIIVPLENVFGVMAGGSSCSIDYDDINEKPKNISFRIENDIFGELLIKFKNAVNIAKGLGPYY